jgi:Rrf2 family protein
LIKKFKKEQMNLLGKTSSYAIRALVYIYIQNKDGKRPGFKEIAKNIDSPEQFTAKILQTLTRNGLISSMKGRGGGFFFDDPAATLALYEVIRIIEGEKYFTKCGFGLKRCEDENPCPLHDDYSQLREEYFKLVTKQSIQSLAVKISDHKAILARV